jgi:hypothetical protein
METIVECLEKATALGNKCAMSTFWKYNSLGLLPKGKKIRGRGNALYVADDTHLRIQLIQFLNESIGIPLDELSLVFGAHTSNNADLWPSQPLPRRVTKLVKQEYQELKVQALRQLLDRLPQLVQSQQKIRVAKMTREAERVVTTTSLRKVRDVSLDVPTVNEAWLRKPRNPL